MKLGLCTGGGDCPGLNAAIRAVVKHAIGSHGVEVIGIEASLTGLWHTPPRVRPLHLESVSHILARGGTILGTSNQGSPFHDTKQKAEFLRAIQTNWRKLNLDALIVIGGDGTHAMAKELDLLGLPIVGIPKTIDNDLPGCELTIGFSTAVEVASDAASRLETSADAHDRIMLLEVMGRDAGHIALQCGLAGGANIILLPEIPFSFDAILDKITARQKLGRNSSLIVVAEGAHPDGGEPVFKASASGTKILGGIANRVALELTQRSSIETRVTVLGHIQRGGTPNAADRILATQFGQRAVELVVHGKTGCIVTYQNGRLAEIPYSHLLSGRRTIPVGDPMLAAAEGIGINLGRPSQFFLTP